MFDCLYLQRKVTAVYALFFLGSGGKRFCNQVNQLVTYCSSEGRCRQDCEESSTGEEKQRLSGSGLMTVLKEYPNVPYLESVLTTSGDVN